MLPKYIRLHNYCSRYGSETVLRRQHRRQFCLSLDHHPFPLPSFGDSVRTPFYCAMLIMFVAFLVAAFAILCIRVPSVWFALTATDEPSDARELSLVVASRALHLPLPPFYLSALHEALTPAPRTPPYPPTGNPFRESGPPACMAKLIMMRHKVRKPPLRSARAHSRLVYRS